MSRWSVNYAEQKVVAEALEKRLRILEAQAKTVFYYGIKKPSQGDWEEAYAQQTGLSLPIYPGIRLIWMNTDRNFITSYATIWDKQNGKATSGIVRNYTNTQQSMGSFRLLGYLGAYGSFISSDLLGIGSSIDVDRVLQLTRQYRLLWIVFTSSSLVTSGTPKVPLTSSSSHQDRRTLVAFPGVVANIVNTIGTSVSADASSPTSSPAITDAIISHDIRTGFLGHLIIESPDYPYINGVMEDSANNPQAIFYGANMVNGYVATTVKRFFSFGQSITNNVLKTAGYSINSINGETAYDRGYIYGWAANEMGSVEDIEDVVL